MSDTMHATMANTAGQVDRSQDRELICALMDGELEGDEVARAIAQCESKDWAAYHLIGDVLRRSDAIAPVSETFAARMSAALAREVSYKPAAEPIRSRNANTGIPAKSDESAGWKRWVAWPAFAVTAAVASVVWVAQPLFDDQASQVAFTQSTPIQPASESAFSDYTEAHRQFAGPIAVQQASYMSGGSQ